MNVLCPPEQFGPPNSETYSGQNRVAGIGCIAKTATSCRILLKFGLWMRCMSAEAAPFLKPLPIKSKMAEGPKI